MKIIPILISLLIISIIFGASVYAQESNILKLLPTDDAFVVADINDFFDSQKIRLQNTGDSKFLKTWYAWSVTEAKSFYISLSQLKFNLTDVEPGFSRATINIKPIGITVLNQTQPVINLYSIDDNSWTEQTLTYSNKPDHSLDPKSQFVISEPDKWHSWDVTSYIEDNLGSEVSVAFGFAEIYFEHEELIIFYSKEADDPRNSPYLQIEYDTKEAISKDEQDTDESNGGGCLIATAAYGSELAPQIQQLRELRDNTVLTTESGTAFMGSFNSFYYSFSPTVADWERENPAFKETVKLAITPLVSSLAILNYLDIDSEAEMLGYGIGIILLNIGMYFVAPVYVIYRLRK